MTISLSGITWDHPRGHGPLAASLPRYRTVRPDVDIQWTVRSLRDFGEMPLEELVNRFDMIVFDHPFIGQAHKLGLLTDISPYISASQREWLDAGALGRSWQSYHWKGNIYGLPIDAAAQVAAWRPDLLAAAGWHAPATFNQLFALAEALRERKQFIALAACPIDSFCMVITLLANTGRPVAASTEHFMAPDAGVEVLEMLKRLTEIAHPESVRMNPIQALDLMAGSDEVAYLPYTFGYTNYARQRQKPLIQFGDIVAAGNLGSVGALLGGAGFGITSRCANPAVAAEYGLWLCHPDYQRGQYFMDGGQPGMLQAWQDPQCDVEASGFFTQSLRTLNAAFLRPRFPGFVPFFEQAGEDVNAFLRGKGTAQTLVGALNDSYRRNVAVEA